MNRDALLSQAAKYRAIAQSLPWNLSGQQNRDYYLSKAIELEQQAGALAGGQQIAHDRLHSQGQAQQQAGGLAESKPAIRLIPQVRVHSILACEVMKHKNAGVDRAYTMWLLLRQQGTQSTWFYLADVLSFFSQEMGITERNIRRWIEAGAGAGFWTMGKRRGQTVLWLASKDKLFAQFGLVKPGNVLLINSSRLMGKLQGARAALHACWVAKENRWASRATITGINGVHERTQRNYDAINGQKKQEMRVENWPTEYADYRQFPNRFFRLHPTPMKKSKGRKFGLYTPEHNGAETSSIGDNAGGFRVLFDNAVGAVKAAEHRARKGLQGQVFSILDYTKRGHITLKVIDYSDGMVRA